MNTTVSDLCDDILMQVFKYLDFKSLKDAALVCKDFNQVVSASTKYKLTLSSDNAENPNWVSNLDEIIGLRRKFCKMAVELNNEKDCQTLNSRQENIETFIAISGRHGSQVQKLTVQFNTEMRAADMVKVLNNMPVIKCLQLWGLKSLSMVEDRNIKTVTLKYLETLTIFENNWKICSFIEAPLIVNLKIHCTDSEDEADNLISFLKASTHLKSLKLGENVFKKLFQSPQYGSFLFRLKTFGIEDFTSDFKITGRLGENFSAFLKTQASSLEELEMECRASHEVHDVILTKLKRLKIFQTVMCIMPQEKEFYNSLKPLESLKQVISAYGFGGNESVERGFLGNCPNLESLDVPVECRLIPFIAANNPKIEFLVIQTLDSDIEEKIVFEFLKVLKIENLERSEFLLSLLRNIPSIESVRVCPREYKAEIFSKNTVHALSRDHSSLRQLEILSDESLLKMYHRELENTFRGLLNLSYNSEGEELYLILEFPFNKL